MPDSAENTGATDCFGLRRFFRRFYWLLDTPASTTPLPPKPRQCRRELGWNPGAPTSPPKAVQEAQQSESGCAAMAPNTTVKTDSPDGKSGVLTVKALTVDKVSKPAGTYTAASEKWLDGKGKVVVSP